MVEEGQILPRSQSFIEPDHGSMRKYNKQTARKTRKAENYSVVHVKIYKKKRKKIKFKKKNIYIYMHACNTKHCFQEEVF